MLELIGLKFMQFVSLYDLYYTWESSGVFDFLLPMLLIFAVVFGILTSTGVLGENRGINFIISVVIALLAMRLPIVGQFFGVIFPGLGIGIAVLIVVLIMAGLFMSDANWRDWLPTFFWGGLIIGLIVVIAVLNNFAWFGNLWWQSNWISVLWVIILLAVMAPFLLPGKTEKELKREWDAFEMPFVPIRGGSRRGKRGR
jgi:hypothetical protein